MGEKGQTIKAMKNLLLISPIFLLLLFYRGFGHKTTPSAPDRSSSSPATSPAMSNRSTAVVNRSLTEIPPTMGSDEEQHGSLTILFILCILLLCILLVHLIIRTHLHYLPESIAIVVLGVLVGLMIKVLPIGNWRSEEMFDPTMFFLVLLPPIILESGYSLHKGNFFQNIGSIIVFAVIGTALSAVVVGGSLFILGKANVVYPLSIIESFAFGSLISAVDPVATLAIFQALDVDPILHMLVFGESVLNDAVSIVMTNTILFFQKSEEPSFQAVCTAIGYFLLMFLGSSAIGIVSALLSALLLKHVNLRATPSLELGTVIVFAYAPYALAESLKLSGIMAILFCGIVMSHYTHFSLSPSTQITVQHVFRTTAFLCETCVFAYLGLAIFSFKHSFHVSLIFWSLFLILLGRAANIFPLSLTVNKFRTVKISVQTQFIMWFSGLRGAIAFALSLHLPFDQETRATLITTTLIIVLCTIVIFGGSALPILKLMKSRYADKLVMSKTEEQGSAVDAQDLEHSDQSSAGKLMEFDRRYLVPFFRRKYTSQEVKDCQIEMQRMTNQWYNGVTLVPTSDHSEQDDDDDEDDRRADIEEEAL
eukprot:m.310047 g.310047  ORF g.310047 m.310047 type:complete len:593 (+) comp49277_c0_seq1:92-1870(+)